MKFQLIVWVCSTHTILRTSKSIGNNTIEKNATRYCAGPAYYRMCSTDVYCSNNGSSSTKGNHHPIISSFLELGRRKLSMQPKFVAAQKMLLKQKPANIRKWIARFYYFNFCLAGALPSYIIAGAIDMGSSICTAH